MARRPVAWILLVLCMQPAQLSHLPHRRCQHTPQRRCASAYVQNVRKTQLLLQNLIPDGLQHGHADEELKVL